MEKFEDLYDDKKLREYSNNIRKFIYNILNDLRDRERNARLSENLFVREIELFSNIRTNIKTNFKKICPDISEEEEKRFDNLIKIYTCLKNIILSISSSKTQFECINSLVNGDLKKIIFIKYFFYPPKYAFIKSLLSLSKCGLCIMFRILLPRCLSNK